MGGGRHADTVIVVSMVAFTEIVVKLHTTF